MKIKKERLNTLLSSPVETSDLLPNPNSYHNHLSEIPEKTKGPSPKIVHLCWTDRGGAGIAAYRLHRGLLAIGADSTMLVLQKTVDDPTVKVLPTSYRSPKASCLENAQSGAMLITKAFRGWSALLSRYPNRPPDADMFSDAASDIRLEYVKEVQEADVVNLHWVGALLDYAQAPVALAEKPVVWTLHDMNPFTGGCHYSGQCRRYEESCGQCPALGSQALQDISWHFHRIKMQALEQLSIHIVTPSKWLGDCSRASSSLGQMPHSTIPYGLATHFFRPLDRARIRASLGIETSKRVILFGAAAMHIVRKGLRYLVEALENLSRNDDIPDILLVTFGHKVEGLAIPEIFPVLHLGQISTQGMLTMLYNAADVFVIPTLEDNLPNTILESFACGAPVVAFNTGGVPDIIEHGITGHIAEKRDSKGLAAGIRWALSDAVQKSNIRQTCRRVALHRYDQTVQARQYLELYQGLIARKKEALACSERGENMALSGDMATAFEQFALAEKVFPFLSRIYNNRGAALWHRQAYAEAVKNFDKALAVNPHDTTALLNLTDALCATGSPDQAMALCAGFLDSVPDDQSILARYIGVQQQMLIARVSQGVLENAGYQEKRYELSAIVIALHGKAYARRTIQDLLALSAPQSVEIICVSNPESGVGLDALMDLQNHYHSLRVFLFDTPEHAALAANIGIVLAHGDYCFCALAGDRIPQDAFRALRQALTRTPDALFAYGNALCAASCSMADDWEKSSECQPLPIGDIPLDQWATRYAIGPHPLWKRDLHEKSGFFDLRYRWESFQDFWFRAALIAPPAYVPQWIGAALLDEKVRERIPPNLRQHSTLAPKFKRLAPLYGQTSESDEETAARLSKVAAFVNKIAQCVETGRFDRALALYEQQRAAFGQEPSLAKIDSLAEKIRAKANSAKA